MSSISAGRPSSGIALYGVSKAALSHLTANLAVELGPSIRVNAVAPGVVKTEFAQPLYEAGKTRSPGPEARDVADAVAFLLSAESSWLTGQTIVLDGGAMLINPAA